MADVDKAIRGLKRMARKVSRDDSPAYCTCGSCDQAVVAAEEILKTMPNGDCPTWVLQVASVLFARAADHAHMTGSMNQSDLRQIFANMAMHSHTTGMGPRAVLNHFDINRKNEKPEPGKPV